MRHKGEMRYEGKAKRVYETDAEGYYIVDYKDDATAFNGEKRGSIQDKGIVNNRISAALFTYLESAGIATHFVERLDDRSSLVRAVEIIPLEVVVRNRVAGSLAKRVGIQEGTILNKPIVEFYYKDDALGDPLVTENHVEAFGWATAAELEQLSSMALQINDCLTSFFSSRGVLLVDFKLEFGKDASGRILLADEISPDTCRFWDAQTLEKLDKDRFRRDLGGVEEAYEQMLQRVEQGGQTR